MKDVDAKRGLVRGVPAVMGGFFGKDLGVIQLVLERRDGRWLVNRDESHSEVRPICKAKKDCVPADPAIAPLVQQAHEAAIAYIDTPIGKSTLRMSSYFADEGNMTALAPVNAAQADYVRAHLPRLHPELATVPVLSAAAAFRTGFGGVDDYTDVPAGPLTLRSAANLYFYPNTLAAVKTDGAGLKAWLEKSAQRFNRIDPAKTGEQPLINTRFTGYNFDQIQGGIHYLIDVSKPVGQRIVSLTFHGKPVNPSQPFIVVTNNYRANGGGHFPGLDGSTLVLSVADGNREILAEWLKKRGTAGADTLEPASWQFAPLKTRGPVVFTAPSGKLPVAHEAGLTNIDLLRDDGDGTATYVIDLKP
jgi:2',3'-cyclic-nucleotide 2'-phosphodiesterase/3'-nucleotidase